VSRLQAVSSTIHDVLFFAVFRARLFQRLVALPVCAVGSPPALHSVFGLRGRSLSGTSLVKIDILLPDCQSESFSLAIRVFFSIATGWALAVRYGVLVVHIRVISNPSSLFERSTPFLIPGITAPFLPRCLIVSRRRQPIFLCGLLYYLLQGLSPFSPPSNICPFFFLQDMFFVCPMRLFFHNSARPTACSI